MGGEGYHELLHVQLVQKYQISEDIAKHLVSTYGAVRTPSRIHALSGHITSTYNF